jgi:hypothetical protein
VVFESVGTLPGCRTAPVDPRCRELEEFLRGLDPEQELIRRWALGQIYPVCGRDGRWQQRTSDLLAQLWPYDEDELAALLRASREVAESIRIELA